MKEIVDSIFSITGSLYEYKKEDFFFVGRDLLIDSCKPSGSNYVYENMILMKIYFTENDFIFNDGDGNMFLKCFVKATENVKCENFSLSTNPDFVLRFN